MTRKQSEYNQLVHYLSFWALIVDSTPTVYHQQPQKILADEGLHCSCSIGVRAAIPPGLVCSGWLVQPGSDEGHYLTDALFDLHVLSLYQTLWDLLGQRLIMFMIMPLLENRGRTLLFQLRKCLLGLGRHDLWIGIVCDLIYIFSSSLKIHIWTPCTN